MVAVPEGGFSAPEAPRAAGGPDGSVPVHERRFVAVAVSAMELLRPESDLVRLVEGAGYVDVLLASEDAPVASPAPLGVLSGCAAEYDGDPGPGGDEPGCDNGCDNGYDDAHDEVAAQVAEIGMGDLHVHRLGLRGSLGPQSDADLVAALSELVGFDPEPGLYLLAPAPDPADPGRVSVNRAAARIAQVYGIPLLRYRCLELTVVDPA